VGNGAARFALQRHGFEVLAVPTVLLSNHPGHGRARGETVPAARVKDLVQGLADLGRLKHVAAVLTGYLGEAAHAGVAAEAVEHVKAANPAAIFMCDPVFGDDGGAYAKPGVAEAIARDLVPVADIVAPNVFELKSLAARQVHDAATAITAAKSLGRPETVVTSVPNGADGIGAVAIQGPNAWCWSGPRMPPPPHGTGDLLSALYLAWRCKGFGPPDALARATSAVHKMSAASISEGLDELPLIARQEWLTMADAAPAIPL
jgi:pyridoxine kinase